MDELWCYICQSERVHAPFMPCVICATDHLETRGRPPKQIDEMDVDDLAKTQAAGPIPGGDYFYKKVTLAGLTPLELLEGGDA